ncbi:GNAT family protein [Chryseobacterium chendengshani]|uniref:hypothetical protein n=1 Tax=unclassified Chryseobacterium TaxID=2593645 RepID=UPI001C63F734|nr:MULTISPECIES: hypothetical protein [unclassified Chryseobacterium]MBW7676612.1 hypothetical protein [Chryseobacterium sp. LJ756]MBW8523154.1 hypothetical protein [Chryseobacterium sp. LJ668]QYK15451.1 hypothetical protein K0U91_10275 [Chryseobacterium sp. LJ668]
MNTASVENQIEFRKNELMHYAPTSFFRNSAEKSFEYFVKNDILSQIGANDKIYSKKIGDSIYNFFYEFLKWDSDFFKMPTYKLNYILFEESNYSNLLEAISAFKEDVVKDNYIFIEIPSEDIFVIQALNESMFRMVETRMTYYLDLNSFENERYPVRQAVESDIPNLKKVSSEMVNPFDRFHADISYDSVIADSFLGVFAEESVKGFADFVMVPDENGVAADSFLTVKYNKSWWDEIETKVSKMVLSAVSSKTNKGWYVKLISEMAYHLREQGAEFALMHPASTNKAVIHSYEKLGCKLGKVSHILTYIKR